MLSAGKKMAVLTAAMLLPLLVLLLLFPSSSELVRLRNAMVFQSAPEADFQWTASVYPADFRKETAPVPDWLKTWVAPVSAQANQGALQQLLQLSQRFEQHKRLGGAIQSDSQTALSAIEQQSTGYCADYTQVTNGIAYALDIPVREWGISFDGFAGHGHALSEIWDEQWQKWIMLDLFNRFYAVDAQSKTPLSVLEFRQLLLTSPGQIEIQRTSDTNFGFRDNQHLLEYFQQGRNAFFMYWANNSLSYDNHPVLAAGRSISPHIEQLLAITLGQFPKIRAIASEENKQQIQHMYQLKNLLWAILALEVLLFLLLLVTFIRSLAARLRRKDAR